MGIKRSWTAVLCSCAVMLYGCGSPAVTQGAAPPVTVQTPVSSAPAETPVQSTAAQKNNLRLAYDANDTLNPYTAKSLRNRQLLPLLYDSLVETDLRFEPQMLLAESVTVQDTICVVRWRKDVQFNDGSMVTGRDVLYSITTVQNSQTQWGIMLQNIASMSLTEDGSALELQLHRPDVDFAAMLTCPIIKEGSANAEFPTTVGKYYVAGAHNTGVNLAFNPLYHAPKGRFETITLYHAANMEALQFRMKSDEIDMGYSGTAESVATGLSVGQRQLKTSSLVYLGVNGQHPLLARAEFRQAVSLALGRDELVSQAYSRKGDAADTPFHPSFYRFGDASPRIQPNLTQANTLLDALGLEKDEAGLRLYGNTPLTLRLVVNTENAARLTAASLLSQQLGKVGIQVEMISGSFSQYTGFLQAGNYDLYLGEVRLTESFDVRGLLNGGDLAYYTPPAEELAEAYEAYRSTGAGFTELGQMFVAYSPFIPLLFPQHDVYVSHSLEANPVCTQQNVFYHILNW